MLEHKMVFELNEEEMALFLVAVGTDEHSGTEVEVAHDIFQGLLDLWLWRKDDVVVVVITSVVTHRDGYREFFLNMMAGDNVLEHRAAVAESLLKKGSEMGCNRMVAYIKPDLADKFGVNQEGSYFEDKHIYTVVGVEV